MLRALSRRRLRMISSYYRFRLSKNLTRRVDQYLVDRVTYLSRNNVQRLIDEGLVKVNGKPTKASYRPKAGNMIEMVAPPEPVNELVPEQIPLTILYEDEHLLAPSKQAIRSSIPPGGDGQAHLVNGLVYYGQKWSTSTATGGPASFTGLIATPQA